MFQTEVGLSDGVLGAEDMEQFLNPYIIGIWQEQEIIFLFLKDIRLGVICYNMYPHLS